MILFRVDICEKDKGGGGNKLHSIRINNKEILKKELEELRKKWEKRYNINVVFMYKEL